MRRRSSRTRRYGVAFVCILLVAGWLAVRAMQVRNHLVAARSSLQQVVDADIAKDPATLRAARNTASTEIASARRAANDPVWRVAAWVPVLGRSFATVRDITGAVDVLVNQALPPLIDAADDARSRPLLADGRVDVARLDQIAARVRRSAASLHHVRVEADRLPRAGLPRLLLSQRDELVQQVRDLDAKLSTATTALGLAPPMLGRDGPRRYLLVVQNNAESRATGGLIGAYAVIRADHGRLTRERVGTNDDLRPAARPVADLGPDFAARYDQFGSRIDWKSAVLTPDWPSAATLLAGLWRAQGGAPLDGVIGIDPIAMAELLRATGPAVVDGRSIGADNVAAFVMRDEYALYGARNDERKLALSKLAAALYDRMTSGAASSQGLQRAFSEMASTGHLQFHSSRAAEQAVVGRYTLGGALPRDRGAFLEVVTQNASGNKLDYYLRRTVGYARPAPGVGRVSVLLESTVSNPGALPSVVTGRLDPERPNGPGETKLLFTVYAGVGAKVHGLRVNGKAVPAEFGTELGHGFAAVSVFVRPGAPVRIEADVDDSGGPFTYRQQPLVVPDRLTFAPDRRS